METPKCKKDIYFFANIIYNYCHEMEIIMNKYLPRIVDEEIENRLSYMAALLIEGCKWCGKSTTAKQHVKSIIEFQNPDNKKDYEFINNTKPSLFLDGDKPRLLDEWQMYPVVWDSIRSDVDKTGLVGQYILTGSAKPVEGSTMHTGTGRFTRLLMRPMSLYESGDSNGLVSLKDIIEGKDVAATSEISLEDIANCIIRGGWPNSLIINEKNRHKVAKDYVESLIREDVNTIDGVERNPSKMRAVLRSLARNVSTPVSNATLIEDVKNEFIDEISRPTLDDYLNTLEKLFVVENVKATNLNIRSTTPLRTKEKFEFVDPSIATAVLGLTEKDLLHDLNYFGFLFENMCIRDLRIYSQLLDGEITYYRDKNDFEVDVILRMQNGTWGAIEIKLGSGYIEEAAQNLLKFKNIVDTNKCGEPAFLMVLSGSSYSYKRPDGVYVISIGTLKN